MPAHPPPTVLTFAASDPTGAAGVLADALTCASMGTHAACALTRVVVQDSSGVEGALALDEEWIDEQARAILQDMPVAAFKVGAVATAAQVQAIAQILADYSDVPVVLDPFAEPDRRASDSGSEAADAELAGALRELLVPQSTVLTLSLAQARALIAPEGAGGDDTESDPGAAACARQLLDWGAEYVLITAVESVGGHVVNRLYGDDGTTQSESIERIDLRFRGAGDTLSAAIAALLAQGIAVGDAVREANEYLGQALAAGYRLGMGAAMPDRLFWAGDETVDDDAGH